MANATLAEKLGVAVVAEWDASQIATMFTDAAKSTEVTDTDPIYTWAATSLGNSHDVIQATSTKRPLYNANVNATGYAGVKFDGTDDALGLIHADFQLTSWYCIVVATSNTQATSDTLIFKGSSGSFQRVMTNSTSLTWRLQTLGEAIAIPDVIITTPTDSKFALAIQSRSDGTTGVHKMETARYSSSADSIGTSPAGDGNFHLGGRMGTSQYFDGWLHHIIVIDSNCNWPDVISAKRIIEDKWGVLNPNGIPQAASGGTSNSAGPLRGVIR